MSDTKPEHENREEEEAASAAAATATTAAADDEDTGAQVAPIVKLEEVAVTTGEEDEDAILDLYVILTHRSKCLDYSRFLISVRIIEFVISLLFFSCLAGYLIFLPAHLRGRNFPFLEKQSCIDSTRMETSGRKEVPGLLSFWNTRKPARSGLSWGNQKPSRSVPIIQVRGLHAQFFSSWICCYFFNLGFLNLVYGSFVVAVFSTMTVQEHSGNEKSCVWHATDFADGELKDELFCIRFASIESEYILNRLYAILFRSHFIEV